MPQIAKSNKKVVYLDDDIQNLNSFKAFLRRSCDVHCFKNPEEARLFLKSNEVPLVVSDFKMPNENGAEFLASVKNINPKIMRVLLTGHADLKGAINSVNQGEIYRYLTKPWNENELHQTIENAFEIYYARKVIEENNIELEKAYKELDNLVYSAVHDIRSPLSSILNLTKFAREEPDQADLYLDMIERTTKKLTRYTREVIKYHKNKRTELNIAEVRFEKLIKEILNEFAFGGKTHDIKIEYSVDQTEEFYSDRSRIYMFLSNLIGNAVKYQRSEPGKKIWIHFNVNRDECVLKVKDNGIGIEQTELAKIFRIYYRATDMADGTGIGLYIVKEAVIKLGGEISVVSEIGEGTEFKIQLPNREYQM